MKSPMSPPKSSHEMVVKISMSLYNISLHDALILFFNHKASSCRKILVCKRNSHANMLIKTIKGSIYIISILFPYTFASQVFQTKVFKIPKGNYGAKNKKTFMPFGLRLNDVFSSRHHSILT
jgi:hypothetical protein